MKLLFAACCLYICSSVFAVEKRLSVGSGSSVRVIGADSDGAMEHAAGNLTRFLKGEAHGAESAEIIVSVDAGLKPLQSRVIVSRMSTGGRVEIRGATPREALQGCCRFEDMVRLVGDAGVEVGTRTFTRLFSPRMTHSGQEIEKYSDEHMDEIARAGMDAIIVFIEDPPDMTRNGRADLPALVTRAKRHGLDVYAYASFPVAASRMHPCDPGAPAYYEKLYGSIVTNAPGLKGLVCVGESVAFPSRDPKTKGYWWKREGLADGLRLNGFWPVPDWVEWLTLVRDVTRRHKPDFDVVFWTYNWFRSPEEERLALLRRIPTDVSLLVTYVMGDDPVDEAGAKVTIDDYSITRPGPSRVFASEARVAGERGIRLYTMANTGGRTWDFGVLPYEPAPGCWIDRFSSMRRARRAWGLVGVMDSHHYGFTPSIVSELAKAAFTEETDEASFERMLDGFAARDFGKENVAAVRLAWERWSAAMRIHCARSFAQWGPLRTGPTYPLVFLGEKLPEPLHPYYETYDGVRRGNGWHYLNDTFTIPSEELRPWMSRLEAELALWNEGCQALKSVLDRVPPDRRAESERQLGVGCFAGHCVRTLLNECRWAAEGLAGKRRDRLLEILADETDNVRGALVWAEKIKGLGWEPSMGFVSDPENLCWKLDWLSARRQKLAAACR